MSEIEREKKAFLNTLWTCAPAVAVIIQKNSWNVHSILVTIVNTRYLIQCTFHIDACPSWMAAMLKTPIAFSDEFKPITFLNGINLIIFIIVDWPQNELYTESRKTKKKRRQNVNLHSGWIQLASGYFQFTNYKCANAQRPSSRPFLWINMKQLKITDHYYKNEVRWWYQAEMIVCISFIPDWFIPVHHIHKKNWIEPHREPKILTEPIL